VESGKSDPVLGGISGAPSSSSISDDLEISGDLGGGGKSATGETWETREKE
jgi:hypothetical protein